MMMKQIVAAERPRERCLQAGARALSLRECLALLINSGPRGKGCLGVARDLLERPGSGLGEKEEERALFNALETQGDGWLTEIKGLGEANRARLLAAFELARRYAGFASHAAAKQGKERAGARLSIEARALRAIPMDMRRGEREWIAFVPVYMRERVGEFCLVEIGARTHVNTDALELFARLLPLRPRGFFLFHNHPSGNLTPSAEDGELTEAISRIAALFAIEFLGHAVVAASGDHWI